MSVLILGDISGIQDFVFAVPEEEGGQARMLRARSFFVQVLTEVLAFRVQRALGLSRESLLFSAAGKFAIEANGETADAERRLVDEQAAIEAWLVRETAGTLRFALATASPDPGAAAAVHYEHAIEGLQRAKLRAWSAYAANDGGIWRPERLVLSPTDPRRVHEMFRSIGRTLPSASAVLIVASNGEEAPIRENEAVFALPGFRATLHHEKSVWPAGTVVLRGNLKTAGRTSASSSVPEIRRPLARYVPTHLDGSPVWFEDLARRARGAPYLGVLKMDADSLGLAIRKRLFGEPSLTRLALLSEELDDFFAIEVDQLARTAWQSTYMVFSGGDDLLLVGPWDQMLDLSSEIRQRFHQRFGSGGMTISGGLALVRHRFPIRRAAAQADELLEKAKDRPAPDASAPKDQMAALGQVWKWDRHTMILAAGRRLAAWVETGVAHRGWLHTLLALTRLQRGELSNATGVQAAGATARLAYHVGRNYPRQGDCDPTRRALRDWADRVIEGFDRFADTRDAEIVYLPAIIRYALLATRPRTEGQG